MTIIKEDIIIPAVPEHHREKLTYICDICGHTSGQSFATCSLCGRLVCNILSSKDPCIRWDPHEIGDYPASFCKYCYDLKFVKYGKDFSDIEDAALKKATELDEKIRQESLAIK